MSEKNSMYDLLVIGGGPGGYVACLRAAQLGLKAACIEQRDTLGGTCLNVGCIPSKALLDSSHRFYQISNEADEHGIRVGQIDLDLGAMMARKEKIVGELTGGISLLFKRNKIKWIQGTARMLASSRVEVTDSDGHKQEVKAKAIVLATGSCPVSLPGLEFDGLRFLSSTEALSLTEVPQHLAVVGGGAIGLELGQVWHRLGAQVTVIELFPNLLPHADLRLAKRMAHILKKQGLAIHTGTRIKEAKILDHSVELVLETRGRPMALECDKVLVAVGRKPNIKGLGLEALEVQYDNDSGRIIVGDDYSTSVKGLYAVGDIIDGPMLAHKASEEGVAVAEIIAGERVQGLSHRVLPSVVYTSPEMAGVGLTEEAARKRGEAEGSEIQVGSFPFLASGRAKCTGDAEGTVKVIADGKKGQVLGVHILGPHASELIAEAAVAMELGARVKDIIQICHAHPTLSEAVKEAFLAVDKRALHI